MMYPYRRRPLQQLADQVQAWRSLIASSRTSTRCGAGAAGTMLASGADRALQLGLRILAARALGRRGASAPAELTGQIESLKVPIATGCIENCSVSNQTYEDSYLCNATPREFR